MAEGTRTGDPLDVGVARFSGIYGAERAYADARERDPAAGWLGDAAFVEAHRHGRIVVRGSVAGHYVDVDGLGDAIGPETGRGAAVGAALGLALGPSALAVGLVGGAMAGGSVEASHPAETDRPELAAIREVVPEGSSAIVVVSTPERVAAMTQALSGVAEHVERHPLGPGAQARLQTALADRPTAA